MRQRNRPALHEKLCEILGSRNVYFDPPSNIHINYPCIIYKRIAAESRRADNGRYIVWYPFVDNARIVNVDVGRRIEVDVPTAEDLTEFLMECWPVPLTHCTALLSPKRFSVDEELLL